MSSYQSFLIAPFGTGLDTDQAPWLLPQDAFSNIVNGHIHHGVVEKRCGFTKYGDIVHQDQTNWKITGVTAADPGVVTMTSTTGLTNGDTIEIRNVLGMTELNGNQYIVANLGGTTFELSGVDTSNFTAFTSAGDVYHIAQNRTMGLEVYVDSDNVKEVIAFDTERASKFNPTDNAFDPIDSSNIMGSGNSDYIWAANWSSTASSSANTLYRMYFTNGLSFSAGLNGIRFYDGGTTTTSFRPQINSGAGGPFINGCKLIFAVKQRLLLLHTIEGSTTYPQRVRWSQAQAPAAATGWDDNVAGRGGFVDAPTGDHIITAQFIQDILIVYFTNSVWTLRPTSDPALPFRWDKVNNFRASDAKMSSEQFDRYVIAAGIRGITATDGVETRRFDERIEHFVGDEINDAHFNKVFSKRSFGQRRMWMLYPKSEATTADAALIYDEESSAFSKYDIDMNVLGYGGTSQDAAIDDFGDKAINEFEETLNSFFYDEGSEVFLGGNTTGEIFTMEQGGDDNEFNFSASIVNVTQANPGVVQMTGDVGLSNGDIVTISGVVGMTEINNRQFVVANKTGNEFQLQGENTTAFTAYTSGGTVGVTTGDSIQIDLESAAWNPWMSEGKQSQMGYLDLFLDTHPSTSLTAKFFTNNSTYAYAMKTINLLPNLVERSTISNITNANPGTVSSNQHGLTTNDVIYIYCVEGMDAVNDVAFTVTVVDGDTFTIGVDTTNHGTYINGGVITELAFESGKAWKRIYAGGTGYQHRVELTSSGRNRPLRIHAFMPAFKKRAVRAI